MYTHVWNVILSILKSQMDFCTMGFQNWQDYISDMCDHLLFKWDLFCDWVKKGYELSVACFFGIKNKALHTESLLTCIFKFFSCNGNPNCVNLYSSEASSTGCFFRFLKLNAALCCSITVMYLIYVMYSLFINQIKILEEIIHIQYCANTISSIYTPL